MFIKSGFFSFEASFCAFSFVGRYIFPMQHPAVVAHHICILLTLIPSLHFLDILVKSLTLLFTNSTKIFREVIEMGVQKMEFKTHRAFQIFKIAQHIFYDIFKVQVLLIPSKLRNYIFKRTPC